MRRWLLSLSLVLLSVNPSTAQFVNSPTAGTAPFISTAPGAMTAANSATRWGEVIDLKADFGAKGDTVSSPTAVQAAGSNQLCSVAKAPAPAITFTSADVGKVISNSGTGPNEETLTGTITGLVSANCVTVSFTASFATPWYGPNYTRAAAPGAGYAPGQPLGRANDPVAPGVTGVAGDQLCLNGALAPGTGAGTIGTGVTVGGVPPVAVGPSCWTVFTTAVQSATVQSGGTGGINGLCTLLGTSPTAPGSALKLQGTIVGGALTSPLTVVADGGIFFANPTSPQPVTGCGLVGTTVNLVMGATRLLQQTRGHYTVMPTGTGNNVGTTTNHTGTGAQLFLSAAQIGGIFWYGTDDSAALANATNAALASATARRYPVGISIPAGTYTLKSTPNPLVTGQTVGYLGAGEQLSRIHLDPTYCNTGNTTADVFSFSETWDAGAFAGGASSAHLAQPYSGGATVTSLSVYGDRTAKCQQNVVGMYDRNRYPYIANVSGYYVNGSLYRSGYNSAARAATNLAYTTEGGLYKVRCHYCGVPPVSDTQPSDAVVEVRVHGGGGAEFRMNDVDIFASLGRSIAFRTQSGASEEPRQSHSLCVHCRIENTPQQITRADMMVIGDATDTGGHVAQIYITDSLFINSNPGFSALRLDSDTAADQPKNINFTGDMLGGQTSGYGLFINSGTNMAFRLFALGALNYDYVVGHATVIAPATCGSTQLPCGVGANIVLSGNGLEGAWTGFVDPSADGLISFPLLSGTGGTSLGSMQVLCRDAATVTLGASSCTGTTTCAETVLKECDIPGNLLGNTGQLRISFSGTQTGTAANKNYYVRLSGTSCDGVTVVGANYLNCNASTTSTGLNSPPVYIGNITALTQQGITTGCTIGSSTAGAKVTSAINTTGPFCVKISGALGNNTDSLTLDRYSVEALPGP